MKEFNRLCGRTQHIVRKVFKVSATNLAASVRAFGVILSHDTIEMFDITLLGCSLPYSAGYRVATCRAKG
jgi:hypothetical protein